MTKQYELEEEAIIEAANRGEITNAEATRQIQELHRDYRAEAQEAAREAYERELSKW